MPIVPPATAGHSALPTVATVLTPDERLRVDAAGQGLYRAVHRDTLDDVLQDLRQRRAGAVLLSVARCSAADELRLATVVREFPRVPAVALLTPELAHLEGAAPRAVLALGRSGVRTLVDVRGPGGWRELREVLTAEGGDDVRRTALDALGRDLAG